MKDRWLKEAVTNNAAWCDAIAASHGISTKWHEAAWVSEHTMPPLYPNLVTLRSGALVEEKTSTIDAHLPSGWGIKDSFSELELKGQGFTLAFYAYWYCCLPNLLVTKDKGPAFRLEAVKSQSELSRWVAAWGEGNGIFIPTLLDNISIELLYLERNGKIVSGLATNQSGDSVGISNTFGSPEDILCCVALVVDRHPMKGIVGYGGTAELNALSKIGFNAIGNLRVWLRS